MEKWLGRQVLGSLAGQTLGPWINGIRSIIRGCQDVMGTFILGGVFDRFPGLGRLRRGRCWLGSALDVPHSDLTWPLSQTMREERTKDLSEQERNRISRTTWRNCTVSPSDDYAV